MVAAIDALHNGRYAEALREFHYCAEKGNSVAQCNLSHMYIKGQGVPIVPVEALRWATLAADQGSSFGLFLIGWIRFDRQFGIRDLEAARKSLREAIRRKDFPQLQGGLGGDIDKVEMMLLEVERELSESASNKDPFCNPERFIDDQFHFVSHVLADDLRSVCSDLARGADPNKADSFGMPPLAASVGNDNIEMTVTLLANGANPNTYAGQEAGHVLAMAAAKGNTELVKLLLKSGATVNLQDDDGWHAMIFAAGAGDTDMVEELIKRGSDVNMADYQGWTPLMQAARYNRSDVVRWLVIKGARVQVQDKDGWTALSIAEKFGHKDICTFLSRRSV